MSMDEKGTKREVENHRLGKITPRRRMRHE